MVTSTETFTMLNSYYLDTQNLPERIKTTDQETAYS
jgi:hypothetical protein